MRISEKKLLHPFGKTPIYINLLTFLFALGVIFFGSIFNMKWQRVFVSKLTYIFAICRYFPKESPLKRVAPSEYE